MLDHCDIPRDPDACWEWNMVRDGHGYGRVRFDKNTIFAHRVLYVDFSGVSLTPSTGVFHACDNPPCCNPGHLFHGSQVDNVHDMIAKGRGHDGSRSARGQRHGMAKINEATALSIFRAEGKLDEVAKLFNVTRDTVEKIKYGRTWNHITGLPRRKRIKKSHRV